MLVGKLEGIRPQEIIRHRGEDKVGLGRREGVWQVEDWIRVVQWRAFVKTVMSFTAS